MTVTSNRPIYIDGIPLNTFAYNIEIVSGLYGWPGKRGISQPIPYKDGAYSDPFKLYNAKTLYLSMFILPFDVDGAVTHSEGKFGHLYDNLDYLLGLFHSDTFLTLKRTMADGSSTREIEVEVLNAFPMDNGISNAAYSFIVELVSPNAFWNEMPPVSDTESAISSFPHAYSIATGGNVPIGDATYTFTCTVAGANPYLEVSSTGERISLSGSFGISDEIIVNLADSIFTLNGTSTAVVRKNRAWYIRLPHNQAALGLSFGADSGTWSMKIDWNNKWL